MKSEFSSPAKKQESSPEGKLEEKYNTQMINNQNIPKLRFKEFSREWEEKNFEDIFSFSTGKNIKQNEASPKFETPCVRYGELYHMYGEVILEIINRTNLDKSELLFSQGNEILLPSAGEDPLDIGSASALTVANVAIGRTINILKPLLDNVYSQKYAAYYINQKLRKKISTLAKGVSISNVYNSDLKKLIINLPCLSEQKKIASFLSSVDTKINQLTKKQTLLKQYKKGVMQKLFSQELRFKADDGSEFSEWEEKILGEITKKVSIKNKDNQNLPVYSISNKHGFIPQGEQFEGVDSNSRNYDISMYKIVGKNMFAYNPARINVGSIGYSGDLENIIISSLYVCFQTAKQINDSFFLQFLETFEFKKQVIRNTEGGVRDYLFYDNFSNIKTKLPSFEEQTKIANFLTSIDTEITQRLAQGERLKQFKKGLLQQMFV